VNTLAPLVTAEELSALTVSELADLDWRLSWQANARPEQLPPSDPSWTQWGLLAGRGYGKTRVGAEWLGRAAFDDPMAYPSAVIAPTLNDVRFTCFEGPAGLLNVIPPEHVKHYSASDRVLLLSTGATIRGFGSDAYERLRGPQVARAWCDELAAWLYPQETWDMMTFGLRLGNHTQVVWTTTPKPIALVRDLIKPQPGRVITRGTTYDNRANLAPTFFDELTKYEGTTIGRQELLGEMIDPEEAGIIQRSWFKLWPAGKPLPDLEWIVMSLDTAFTAETVDRKTGDPDYSACTVWGVFIHEDKRSVMLLDCWQERLGLPDLIERVKKEQKYTYGDDQDRALIKPKFGSNKPLLSGRSIELILIEDKGSGISLRQTLERDNLLTYGYNPGRADKLSRLHIVSQAFKNGRIWLPESTKMSGKPVSWCDEMVSQLCSFTGARRNGHDDYVDSTTQAIRLFMDKGMLDSVALSKRPPPPPPRERPQNPYAR
jgi:predicted phage terminase large subunit-like protein